MAEEEVHKDLVRAVRGEQVERLEVAVVAEEPELQQVVLVEPELAERSEYGHGNTKSS
mgnify:CR=1 FL=1